MLTLVSKSSCVLGWLCVQWLAACGSQDDAVVSIVVHPTNANILYVATNEAVYSLPLGVRGTLVK